MSAERSVLALNVGSSTLKFALFSSGPAGALESLYEGTLTTDGQSHHLQHQAQEGRQLPGDTPLAALLAHLRERALPSPQVVGHRLVHGGTKLREHALIDASVLRQLQDATAFAPLHLPPALALIHDAMQRLPQLPQVACLDTAFHRDLPALAQTLPLSAALRQHGLQRYGFHGLSCESIVQQLHPSLPTRLVIAHLGSGASVTAVQQGRSIDTSMSLTPTGGVVMGTRPGDLDPGMLLYLMRAHGYSAGQLEDLLDHHAGLQGLAGESDVRRLLDQETTREPARLALAIWVRSVAKAIAGMAVSLGGLDRLVFTGGIGEHAAPLRQRIAQQLMPLLPGLNSQVLPSQENRLIAQHALQLTAHPAAAV